MIIINFADDMLTLRILSKIHMSSSFVVSCRNISATPHVFGNKQRKVKRKLFAGEEGFDPSKGKSVTASSYLNSVTASSYLTKEFKGKSDIDWEKLKTQIIGGCNYSSLLLLYFCAQIQLIFLEIS